MSFDASFWDERYSSSEYIYGTAPNEFLRHTLETFPHQTGTAFFPADGEGRNSVYAAKKGFVVTAADWSREAQKKALALANQNRVSVNFLVGKIEDIPLAPHSFDLIGLFYFHLPESERELMHSRMVTLLKPGGMLIFEAFNRDQLGKKSGGPQNLDLLYSLEQITSDFIDLDFELLKKETVSLKEGKFHEGEAVVIRFLGIKR